MSFKLKTIIGIAFIEGILLTLIIFNVLNNLNKTNQQQVNEQVISVTQLFVAATQNAILSYDLASIEAITAQLVKNPSIEYVRITGPQARILSHAGTSSLLPDSIIIDTSYSDVDDNVYDHAQVLKAGSQDFGMVNIGFNILTLNQATNKTRNNIISIAIIEMILVALFSFFLGNYLTSQLKDIKKATTKISKRDYTVSIENPRKDEIGEVASAFNNMSKTLLSIKLQRDNYEKELKLANKELEQRVEKRTHQLFTKNSELVTINTQLKNAQTMLVEQEKLASIGMLSAGLAHEINNPIGAVLSNITTLKSYIEILVKHINSDNDEVEYVLEDSPDLIEDCIQAVDQVRKIIDGLQTFSKDQKHSNLIEVDLKSCLEHSLSLFKNIAKDEINIEYNIENSMLFLGEESKMIQVITNLLINSKHALDDNPDGKITIKTFETSKNIILSICDNGSGIPQDVQKRIFEPFFSTKDVNEGTGLGLSIVHGIIDSFDATISVESELGKSTTFTITLNKAS